LQRLRCSLVSEVQGRDRGIGHQARIPYFRERDQPRAGREAPRQVTCNPNCKSGFAHTTRPDEADQSGRRELLSEFRKLMTASDEASRLSGQVARVVLGPGHGEYETTPRPTY
jgi:hypothetical protein